MGGGIKSERAARSPRNPHDAQLDGWKRGLEHHFNRHLERHGFEPYYDLRSLADRGIDAEPTVHIGKAASALERDGIETEPGRINREIETRNQVREALHELEAKLARQAANQNEGPPPPARAVALAEGRPDEDSAPEKPPEGEPLPTWTVKAAPIRIEPRQETCTASAPDPAQEYLPQWPEVIRPSEKDHPGLFARVWAVVRDWLGLSRPEPALHPLRPEALQIEPASHPLRLPPDRRAEVPADRQPSVPVPVPRSREEAVETLRAQNPLPEARPHARLAREDISTEQTPEAHRRPSMEADEGFQRPSSPKEQTSRPEPQQEPRQLEPYQPDEATKQAMAEDRARLLEQWRQQEREDRIAGRHDRDGERTRHYRRPAAWSHLDRLGRRHRRRRRGGWWW